MRQKIASTLSALVLAAIAVVAMPSDMQAQGAVDGTYRLVEVDGGPLPALTEREGECTEHVTEATLTLDGGEFSLDVTEREECGAESDTETETETGEYSVDGQTVNFVIVDRGGDEDVEAEDDDREAGDDEREAEDDDREADDIDGAGGEEIDIENLGAGTLSGNTLNVRLTDGRTIVLLQR